jgi:hypothetical protein
MIELVLGLDAYNYRRVSVLFEDYRGYKRALEAMSAVLTQHTTKRIAGCPGGLTVITNAP